MVQYLNTCCDRYLWSSDEAEAFPLVDGDPHFIIEIPERNDALCFNINDDPGTIMTLVRDPELGKKKQFALTTY